MVSAAKIASRFRTVALLPHRVKCRADVLLAINVLCHDGFCVLSRLCVSGVSGRVFSCISQVVAATNRIDILDPALLRSGRLDRKIEFPHPTEEARARILQIHSRKMNVSDNVNYEELARCTDDFNGAQLKVTTLCI
jgi:SpoVK/Ycf46/Vps4 family AAA+-type ATPase